MAKLEDNKTIRCSFCGKPQETVKRITAHISRFFLPKSFDINPTSAIAIPLAIRYGTPLPIVLNESVRVISCGIIKFAGRDWIAKDSATEILLGK